MLFRRHPEREAEDDEPRRPPDRTLSTRLAWAVLVGGAVLVVTRVSVATVVQVHGDGMAPTLVDGDHVVMMRDRWTLERGDIVVYDPTPVEAPAPAPALPAEGDAPRAPYADGSEFPDVRHAPEQDFRNTAVVDREELEENWKKVQRRSAGLAHRAATPLRVGRILALPGQRVTFHVPDATLGLAIDGEPLHQKPGDALRIVLDRQDDASAGPKLRATAYETTSNRRYTVLMREREGKTQWPGSMLPPASGGPVEVEAEGYLVVADNRQEGACCDSRAIGWVPAESIKGKVVVRLAGDARATPDLDPAARGFLWKP
jgi:signal peptidase I